MKKQDNCLIIEGNRWSLKIRKNDQLARDLFMLFSANISDKPVEDLVKDFGYSSKVTFYNKLNSFQEEGSVGIMLKKRGPKNPFKRSEELVKRAIAIKFEEPRITVDELLMRLTLEGFELSKRTLQRVLQEYDLGVKKTFKFKR